MGVDPIHQAFHIPRLFALHIMKRSPQSFALQPLLVLCPHLVLRGQPSAAREHCRNGNGLELKETERCCVEGNSYKCKCWVRDVEEVLVEIVHLGSVRDKHRIVCLVRCS